MFIIFARSISHTQFPTGTPISSALLFAFARSHKAPFVRLWRINVSQPRHSATSVAANLCERRIRQNVAGHSEWAEWLHFYCKRSSDGDVTTSIRWARFRVAVLRVLEMVFSCLVLGCERRNKRNSPVCTQFINAGCIAADMHSAQCLLWLHGRVFGIFSSCNSCLGFLYLGRAKRFGYHWPRLERSPVYPIAPIVFGQIIHKYTSTHARRANKPNVCVCVFFRDLNVRMVCFVCANVLRHNNFTFIKTCNVGIVIYGHTPISRN